jgi:hypothetical protein
MPSGQVLSVWLFLAGLGSVGPSGTNQPHAQILEQFFGIRKTDASASALNEDFLPAGLQIGLQEILPPPSSCFDQQILLRFWKTIRSRRFFPTVSSKRSLIRERIAGNAVKIRVSRPKKAVFASFAIW